MITSSLFNTVLALEAKILLPEDVELVIANTKFNNFSDAIKAYWNDFANFADPNVCSELMINIWDKVIQPRKFCSLLRHSNQKIWFDDINDFYEYQKKMGYTIIIPQYKAILKDAVKKHCIPFILKYEINIILKHILS